MSTGIPSARISLTTHTKYGGLISCSIDIAHAAPEDWDFVRRLIALFMRREDPSDGRARAGASKADKP